jgi:hypothetical protein
VLFAACKPTRRTGSPPATRTTPADVSTLVVWVAGLTAAMSTATVIVTPLALPAIVDALGIEAATAGNFGSAPLWGAVVGIVWAGVIGSYSDRKAMVLRRLMLAFALVVVLVLCFELKVSGFAGACIVWLDLFLLGWASATEPLLRSLVSKGLGRQRLAEVAGWLTAVFAIGLVVLARGPAALSSAVNLPVAFAALGALILVIALSCARVLVDDADNHRRGSPVDGLKALTAAARDIGALFPMAGALVSGIGYGLFIGSQATLMSRHGWEGWWLFVPGLAGISTFLVVRWWQRHIGARPSQSGIWSAAAQLAAVVLLSLVAPWAGVAWLAGYAVANVAFEAATNCVMSHGFAVAGDDAARASAIVVVRVLGIAIGAWQSPHMLHATGELGLAVAMAVWMAIDLLIHLAWRKWARV